MNAVLIGYGYWGRIIEKYLSSESGVSLKKIFRGREGNEIIEYILDNFIDSAFVCTPVETHYEITKKLLENKVNVFCEKPLSSNMSEAKELFEIAHNNKCTLFVDYIYRYSKSIQYLKEVLPTKEEISLINMKIKQFGNFYDKTDITEIVGIHMLSVIPYIFDDNKIDVDIEIICEKTFGENIIYRLSKLNVFNIDVFIEESVYSLDKVRTIEIISKNSLILFDMLSEFTIKSYKGKWDNQNFLKEEVCENKFDEKNNLIHSIQSFANVVSGIEKYNYQEQDILLTKMLSAYKKSQKP